MVSSSTRRSVLWVLFCTSLIAAWLLGDYGWMLHWWLIACLGLALGSLLLGVLVIRTHERRALAAAIVGIGLLVGNWRLVEVAAMVALWSIRGFAP